MRSTLFLRSKGLWVRSDAENNKDVFRVGAGVDSECAGIAVDGRDLAAPVLAVKNDVETGEDDLDAVDGRLASPFGNSNLTVSSCGLAGSDRTRWPLTGEEDSDGRRCNVTGFCP